MKEIADDLQILIFLITFPQNKKINDFIFSSFRKISYENRQYVFGYSDYNEDKDIRNYFNLKLNNTNEIKLVIYDFNERMHYIHKKTFNINMHNEIEIFNEIQNLIKNINNLKYTSGSIIKDWIAKIGFEKMSSIQQIIFVGIFVFIILGLLFFCSCLSGSNNDDDSESFEDEDNEGDENSNEEKINRNNNQIIDKEKEKNNSISNKEKKE